MSFERTMKPKLIFHSEKGVTLVEILVGIILLTIVCISSLNFFAYGLGGIGKEGNRRAAMERARQQIEQIISTAAAQLPARDGNQYWCSNGNPCTSWTLSGAPIAQTISVNDLPSQRMETRVQGVHDPSAGTPITFYDAWEIGVKVWFTSNTNLDDDFNRVYIKTLRSP